MPGDNFNFEKFHVGGCIPSKATVHCSKCEWEDDSSENMTEKALWRETEQ